MKSPWKTIAALALCATALTACVSPSGDTKDQQLASAMAMHDAVLARATAKFDGLQAEIDNAAGYAVFETGVLKILIVGTAGGYGVVVDNSTAVRTIVDNFAIALGPGVELSRANAVIVFHTKEALQAALDGDDGWDFGASAMIGLEIGDVGGDASTSSIGTQSSTYRDMDYGVGIHASVFWLDSDPDEELN